MSRWPVHRLQVPQSKPGTPGTPCTPPWLLLMMLLEKGARAFYGMCTLALSNVCMAYWYRVDCGVGSGHSEPTRRYICTGVVLPCYAKLVCRGPNLKLECPIGSTFVDYLGSYLQEAVSWQSRQKKSRSICFLNDCGCV